MLHSKYQNFSRRRKLLTELKSLSCPKGHKTENI